MTAELQSIINSVQQLSHSEQAELIQVVSQSLNKQQQTIVHNQFLHPKTLEEIMAEGGPKRARKLSDLKADFWPENEPIDDFVAFVRKQRAESRA